MAGMPSLAPLYAKALLGSLPLPLIGAGGDELPDTVKEAAGVEVDRANLAAYQKVCGFRVSDALPATYPHVLAFPLAMALMTDRSFPFGLLGLVHVANRIEQRRVLGAAEPLDLRVWAEELRPHPRGRQLDVVAEASAGGEVVWTDRSTYLKRGKGSGERAERPEPPADPAAATWKVSGDIGRRYAAVAGDRNPIHLHPLSAKAFGFPRAIAHGMWTKARCLGALEARLPDAYSVEVAFRAPVLLPATVRFASEARGGGWAFALTGRDGERVHLTGAVEA